MEAIAVPIVNFRVLEPEGIETRALEEQLNELGSKGYEVASFIPRTIEGPARLVLARRVGLRRPGDSNGHGRRPEEV